MLLRAWLLTALCLALLPTQPQMAAAQDISRVVAIDRLAQYDPIQALQSTDVALRDPQVLGTPPNLRILVDLLLLRAELLETIGQTMTAGDAWMALAVLRPFRASHYS